MPRRRGSPPPARRGTPESTLGRSHHAETSPDPTQRKPIAACLEHANLRVLVPRNKLPASHRTAPAPCARRAFDGVPLASPQRLTESVCLPLRKHAHRAPTPLGSDLADHRSPGIARARACASLSPLEKCVAVTSFTVVVPRPSSANPTAATDTIRARGARDRPTNASCAWHIPIRYGRALAPPFLRATHPARPLARQESAYLAILRYLAECGATPGSHPRLAIAAGSRQAPLLHTQTHRTGIYLASVGPAARTRARRRALMHATAQTSMHRIWVLDGRTDDLFGHGSYYAPRAIGRSPRAHLLARSALPRL